jgi:hypothetical protein
MGNPTSGRVQSLTAEQRDYLEEIVFRSPERLGDEQRFEKFKLKFNQASGPYARALRLSRKQIKGWASSENRKRQMGAARAAAAVANDEEENDDAGAAAQANPPPQAAVALAAARTTNVGVKEMRAEMRQLGYSAAEAKAPKGRVAVLAALIAARANPRQPAPPPTAAAAAPTDATAPALAAAAPVPTVPTIPLTAAAAANTVAADVDGGNAAEGADGGNAAGLSDDDDYEEDVEVEDVVDVRKRRGVEEFRVRWKGCAPSPLAYV